MVVKTAQTYQIEARIALDQSGVNCDRVPKRSMTLTTVDDTHCHSRGAERESDRVIENVSGEEYRKVENKKEEGEQPIR